MKFTILNNDKLQIDYEDSSTKSYIYTSVLTYSQLREKLINNMDGWYINNPKEAEESFDESLFDGSLNSAAKLSDAIYENANNLIEDKDIKLFFSECILDAESYINRSHKTMTLFEKTAFEDAVLKLTAAEFWGKANIAQLNNVQEAIVSTPRATYLQKVGYARLRRLKREKMVAI